MKLGEGRESPARNFALEDVNKGHLRKVVGSWGLEPQTSTVSR